MKFAFIAVEKAWASIHVSCKILDVSRSGFYAWQRRAASAHAMTDNQLAVHIGAAFEVGRGAYGSPRVHEELKAQGIAVSRKRIARIMRERGLEGRRKRKFKATTDSSHALRWRTMFSTASVPSTRHQDLEPPRRRLQGDGVERSWRASGAFRRAIEPTAFRRWWAGRPSDVK